MNRILIVEDEAEMRELLSQSLTDSGYVCSSASNGQTGLAKSASADLILVDVMMPSLNGYDMIRRLRERGNRVPVIFLTAKDTTKDLVLGLEVGADDYIVKPFKLDELLARIKAILRRMRETSTTLVWNDFVLDCSKRTAFRDGHEIFFSPTEFSLFELLMRNADRVLSKNFILEQLWADQGYRRENIVETYVNYLRGKTEMRDAPRVIHTVRRRGYVLAKTSLEP